MNAIERKELGRALSGRGLFQALFAAGATLGLVAAIGVAVWGGILYAEAPTPRAGVVMGAGGIAPAVLLLPVVVLALQLSGATRRVGRERPSAKVLLGAASARRRMATWGLPLAFGALLSGWGAAVAVIAMDTLGR